MDAGVVRLQTGYLYHYAFVMLIGVAALVTCFMFVGSALMTSMAHPVRRHLPAAVGVLFILALIGVDEAVRRIPAGSRCGPRSSPSRSR